MKPVTTRRLRILQTATAALLVFLAAPAAGSRDASAAEKARTVEGEVVQVRESAGTASQGAFTEIRVRTRQQQESWFRLGPAAEYGARFRQGDRVRARVPAGGGSAPAPVQEIRNQRSGERLKIRAKDGTLLRVRDRDRQRDGTGESAQKKDRTRQGDGQDRAGRGQPSTRGGAGRTGGGSGKGSGGGR